VEKVAVTTASGKEEGGGGKEEMNAVVKRTQLAHSY